MKATFKTSATINTTVDIVDGDTKELSQNMTLNGVMEMNEDESEMELFISGEVDSSKVGIDMLMNEAGLAMSCTIDDQAMVFSMVAEDPETMESLAKSEILRLITEDGKEVTIKLKQSRV